MTDDLNEPLTGPTGTPAADFPAPVNELPFPVVGEAGLLPTAATVEFIETRFKDLEDSNARLAADVRALTSMLQVVNDLQIEQRAAQRRADATEKKVQAVESAANERIARTRQAVNIAAATLAVLLPVVSIIVYISLINHVNDLIDVQNRNAYTNCNIRNRGTMENADREGALAKLEDNPALKKIHTDSSVKLRGSLTDCSKYKK